jgi:Rieske 2Fe-2S family protein
MEMSAGMDTVSAVRDLIGTCRSGWSLPRAFYQDPFLFRLDLTHIFGHHWLFCGHVNQISRPGDYFVYNIADESVIIVSDSEQEIRGYFNVCRHRGSRICRESCGHVKRFQCPYHQWTYDLDGALVRPLCMPDTFEPREFGLHSAHIRVIEGLIFVCLSETPPDFTYVEHDLTAQLRMHELHTAKVSSSRSYQVHANWKIINENARECYHCPTAHPEYCRAVMSAGAARSKQAMEKARSIQAQEEQRWRGLGLDAENKPFRPGTLHSVNRFALDPQMVTESLDGQLVAPRMGKFPDSNVGVAGIGIYPNFLMEACSDHAVTLRFTPVNSQLTEVNITWYVSGDARENIDYVPDRVEAVWRATAEQDWRLCETNQQGVNSSHYSPGPYATNEEGCDHFDQWYVRELSSSMRSMGSYLA